MAKVRPPMWVPPSSSKKRQRGRRKQSLNFRVPDRVLAYVQERESEGRNKTDVAVELLELAIDLRQGLGKEGWREVFIRSSDDEISPGAAVARMLFEGLACLSRESKGKK